MSKVRDWISCFLLAVCLVGLFSACGGASELLQNDPARALEREGDSDSSGKINLKLWHIWVTDSESNKLPFEKALADWNRENPGVRITAEATENETYKVKIRTAVAVNEAPDIFYCWGAGFARPFVDAKKVLPLDEYLDGKTRRKLLPGTTDYFTYDGKLYALPIFMITGVMYYNVELFNRYDVDIPVTFDDLITAVKAFKQRGIIPMAVGEKDGWTGMFYQNILAIRTAGTKLCNQALNKQASFRQPEFVESAEKLAELIKAGAFDSGCMQQTRDEAEADFKIGKAAMYYNGSWVAGSLDKEDCPVKGKIIVRNFPAILNSKGDPNGFLGGAIDTFMISANTKHKVEAVRALEALDESFCRESYLAGASQPAWKVEVDVTEINPLAADISRLLKNSTGFVLAWDTFLPGEEAQTHINLVADIFAGRRTPEEFAAEMQKLNEPKNK